MASRSGVDVLTDIGRIRPGRQLDRGVDPGRCAGGLSSHGRWRRRRGGRRGARRTPRAPRGGQEGGGQGGRGRAEKVCAREWNLACRRLAAGGRVARANGAGIGNHGERQTPGDTPRVLIVWRLK